MMLRAPRASGGLAGGGPTPHGPLGCELSGCGGIGEAWRPKTRPAKTSA